MTEQLPHDPRIKQQIKDVLYDILYTPIQKQFKQRLEQIIVRNAVLGGYDHMSFVYKGVLYNRDHNVLPRKMNRLVIQLQPAMNEYLKELKQLNEKELPYVLGYINQVLNSSNELHDYLRLLPPSVHPAIQGLINTCSCRGKRLPDETVALLQEKNLGAVQLMKNRMVTNLLI